MKESHKRSRNPKYKPKHSGKNWAQYEQSLRNRGNLMLWLSPKAIKLWKSKPSGKPGRQQKYVAIETILTLRLLFHLPLRQTEGFVLSLFEMMKVSLPIPDHTTLSRRSKSLKPILKCRVSSKQPLHLIVDSTGLSIHGEGPWVSGKKRLRKRTGALPQSMSIQQFWSMRFVANTRPQPLPCSCRPAAC